MSAPTVLKNSFMKTRSNENVDYCSVIIIIVKCICGVNIVNTITNNIKKIIISYFYSLFLFIYLTYLIVTLQDHKIIVRNLVMNSKYVQMTICVILALFTSKYVSSFFKILTKLDADFGVTFEVSRVSIKLSVVLFIMILAVFFLITLGSPITFFSFLVLVHSVEVAECIFAGHLITLVLERLRLVNDSIEASLNKKNREPVKISLKINGSSDAHMKALLKVYRNIIDVHRLIVKATQWQILIIIITAFVFILIIAHDLTRSLVRNEFITDALLLKFIVITVELTSLIVPCICNDSLRDEVQRFRQLLATKLYADNLDKPGRSTVRILLSLSKTRNLSFSLLRMIDVSISLPFKFVGVLVTYLIILLQFEKVLYP